MKTKHYVITGVVAYLFFLITTLPASTTTRLLDESLPQLAIQGVAGTLWNGTAHRITISPNHVLDNVSWSVCSWRLLIGEICVNLDATHQSHSLQGQFGLGITGTISARDLRTKIDANSLGKMAGLPLAELSGLISINLDSMDWAHGETPKATGTVLWQDAAIRVAETALLGEIMITLNEGDESSLLANINNKGGDINVTGSGNINDNGDYDFELQLTPTNTASDNLTSSLSMFAKKQSNGNFVFKNSGNLERFGIM